MALVVLCFVGLAALPPSSADSKAVEGEEHEYAAWMRSEFGVRQPGSVSPLPVTFELWRARG